MKLEIQYTEEDFREAQTEVTTPGGRKAKNTMARGCAGWIMFFAMMGALWWLLRKSGQATSNQPQQPVQDLVVALLPDTIIAMGILAIIVIMVVSQVRLARMRAAFGDAAREKNKSSGQVVAFSVLLLGAAASFALKFLPVVEWRPARYEALMVGFAPWLVMLFGLWFVIVKFLRLMTKGAWEQNPALHRPHTLEVTDGEVSSRDINSFSAYQWSAFMRFRETENLFILVLEDMTFLMVPKRVLADAETMMEFRAMIQAHIKEGYFLTTPAGAFPVLRGTSLPPPPIGKV